jgi:hypothetical protein
MKGPSSGNLPYNGTKGMEKSHIIIKSTAPITIACKIISIFLALLI